MNTKDEKLLQGRTSNKLLILTLILFLIGLVYMSSSRENMTREYSLLYELKSLKTLNQKIDTIFNKNTSHQSFDSIVDDINSFSKVLLLLKEYSAFDEEKEHQKLYQLYKKLQSDFVLTNEYVERYKSWNGLSINSTRALFDMHSYMKKQIHEKVPVEQQHKIEVLLDEIVFMVALISYDRLSNNELLEEKVQNLRIACSSNASLYKTIDILEKHIRVLSEGQEIMQALKVENETLNIGDTIDKIYLLLLDDFQSKDQSNSVNIFVLNGIVFLLLFFLFITSKKEMKLHQKVYALNRELAANVNELESVNKKMKKLINKFDVNVIASETDTKGIIVYASKAFCDVSGYTHEELLGQPHNIVRHADISKEVYKEMWATIKAGKEWKGEIKNCRKDGSTYWVDVVVSPEFDKNGEIVGFSAIRHLISSQKELEVLSRSLEEQVSSRTHELEEMVKKVEKLSVTDELTGLYNRRYYAQIIKNEIKRAHRNKVFFGYLMFDIDNFKPYNDNYGHKRGDEVLQKVSKSLLSNLGRPDDFVFRLGGEEFAIIFTSDNKEDAVAFAQRIIKEISLLKIEHLYNKPYGVITASGGLVVCEPQTECLDEDILYKKADELLYEAKATGRNCLKV